MSTQCSCQDLTCAPLPAYCSEKDGNCFKCGGQICPALTAASEEGSASVGAGAAAGVSVGTVAAIALGVMLVIVLAVGAIVYKRSSRTPQMPVWQSPEPESPTSVSSTV